MAKRRRILGPEDKAWIEANMATKTPQAQIILAAHRIRRKTFSFEELVKRCEREYELEGNYVWRTVHRLIEMGYLSSRRGGGYGVERAMINFQLPYLRELVKRGIY